MDVVVKEVIRRVKFVVEVIRCVEFLVKAYVVFLVKQGIRRGSF